ncbi:hypothetical protein ACP4OV_014321 [Aristida adscensionis]
MELDSEEDEGKFHLTRSSADIVFSQPPLGLIEIVHSDSTTLCSAIVEGRELLTAGTGLILFKQRVDELGLVLSPKSDEFKGTKEFTKEQILDQMRFFAGKTKPTIGVTTGSRDGLSAESIARFLLLFLSAQFVLNSVKSSA